MSGQTNSSGGAAGTVTPADLVGGQDGSEQQEQSESLGLLSGSSDEDSEGDGDGNQHGGQGPQAPGYATVKDVESAIDRRINAVLKEIRKGREQNGSSGQEGQQQAGAHQERQPQPQTPTGPSRGDVRDARSSYREYVADEIEFIGNVERDTARTMADSAIQALLARGEDPDDVGRTVASEVAKQIRSLREFYEGRMVSELRRKGLLPTNSGSQQQVAPGTSQAGQSGSSMAAGEARAKALLADRFQTQS